MNCPAICNQDQSQLVIIDMQERLSHVIGADDLAITINNCSLLAQSARLLEVPIIYTEQYPQGLGSTLEDISQWLSAEQRVEKTSFSCCRENQFRTLIDSARPQVILAGMEAHICVLQTALELNAMQHHVFVVEDAVISRKISNKNNALNRLRQQGVTITNTESVIFEWLKVAKGDAFKQIAKLVK